MAYFWINNDAGFTEQMWMRRDRSGAPVYFTLFEDAKIFAIANYRDNPEHGEISVHLFVPDERGQFHFMGDQLSYRPGELVQVILPAAKIIEEIRGK